MRYEFRKPAFSYQTPITMYIRSIGIAALIFGTLFKVLHWPGANIISVISGVLVVAATVFSFSTRTKAMGHGRMLRSRDRRSAYHVPPVQAVPLAIRGRLGAGGRTLPWSGCSCGASKLRSADTAMLACGSLR